MPPSSPPAGGSKKRRRKLHPHEIEKQRKLLWRRISGVLIPVGIAVLGLLLLWTWQQRQQRNQNARRAEQEEAARRDPAPTPALIPAPGAEDFDPDAIPTTSDVIVYTVADVAEAFSRQGPERAYEMLLEMEATKPLTGLELQMMVDLCQNSGRISTARKYINAAMAEDATDPDTLALLSRQCAFEGDLDGAVRHLADALSRFAGSWVDDQSIMLRTAADVGKRLVEAKRYAEVASIVPEEAALRSRDLYLVRLHGLTGAGQRPRILALIDRDPGFLRATEKDRIRAANYWHLGRAADAEAAFDRALELAGQERHARELLALAYLARDFRDADRSLRAMESYLGLTNVNSRASAQIWTEALAMALRAKQTVKALTMAEAMAERFPQHPLAIQQRAHLRFLTRTRMENSIMELERFNQGPEMPLEMLVTLALGYLQNGQAARALALLEPVPVRWEGLPPPFLSAYIGILRANGQTERATELTTGLNVSELLPEELALTR